MYNKINLIKPFFYKKKHKSLESRKTEIFCIYRLGKIVLRLVTYLVKTTMFLLIQQKETSNDKNLIIKTVTLNCETVKNIIILSSEQKIIYSFFEFVLCQEDEY